MTESRTYKTDQEEFWAGSFGSDYIDRNKGAALLASNLNFFSKALHQARGLGSFIEFGANIGMNVRAMKLLYPDIAAAGIEINADAASQLKEIVSAGQLYHSSILDFESDEQWDLALIKGVLIHLNPDVLPEVYAKLVRATRKYLLVAEYYNPKPVTISYRGHSDRLFKRDFAGELMDSHPEMKLVDYGFAYHRDPSFPQDDISWFLMEKTSGSKG